MGIRTKLNPMGGTSGKKYKAYILGEGTYQDVASFGFTEDIDPDKCFASKKSVNNSYFILNGKLFYFYNSQLTQVGSLNTWTTIETGSSGAFGIADNHLYSISGTSATEPYSSLRFKELGTCPNVSNPKPYFITTDSKLYYSSGQVGSLTSWTDITGYYAKSGSTILSFGVGINNGKAYFATDTTTSVINSNWSVVKVSGVLEYKLGRWSTCHFIAQDGKLYYCGNSATQTASPSSMAGQVGSKTSWTDISFDYGIEDGKLYSFSGANANLKNDTLNWTSVSSRPDSSSDTYGIADNDLYYITSDITKLLDNCLKVYYRLAICEV